MVIRLITQLEIQWYKLNVFPRLEYIEVIHKNQFFQFISVLWVSSNLFNLNLQQKLTEAE